MQRNPHSYQIATGYRTFYSLSLIYQPITKKRLFLFKKLSFVKIYTKHTKIDTKQLKLTTIYTINKLCK